MVNKYDATDKVAPLPFCRPLPDFEPNTTKFVFEKEKAAEGLTQTFGPDGETVLSTTMTKKKYMKEVKVTLKVYG